MKEIMEKTNYTRRKFVKVSTAATVGGATEIAAITKHEGYKWVSRKFYYDPKYNLGGV